MNTEKLRFDYRSPAQWFCIGWALVMLSLVLGFGPAWVTFIHMWQVEFFASLFLLAALCFVVYRYRRVTLNLAVSPLEIRSLIVPMLAFICCSALSMLWANSLMSAFHHTLVWVEYLIFYLLVRQVLETGHNYAGLTKMLTGTLCFFSILAVFSYLAFLIFGGGTSVGIIYSKYGEQIVTLFPLLVVGVLRQQGRKFAIGTTALALLWLLIYSSQSRASLIVFTAVVVAMSAVVFFLKRFRPHRVKMAVLLIAFVVAPTPLQLVSAFSQAKTTVLGRIRDDKGNASSNDFRKLMIHLSVGMIKANPVLGLGADNFGFEANKYRAEYASQNPDDPVLAEAESYIPERAHNEYLQITAELGIVGIIIFSWFLFGIAVMGFRLLRNFRSSSPYAIAAMIGIGAFLVSSVVTSYSFRLIQNGFVFFFVLAVAAKLLLKRKEGEAVPIAANKRHIKLALATGCLACLSLAGLSAMRVTSTAITEQANQTASIDKAFPVYRRAMSFDSTNPEAAYSLGLRLIDAGRYADAVPHLKESIKIGKARSTDFSFLATAQSLAGDDPGAEQTFAQAVALYPRSVFVLTRYAALLDANGEKAESQRQFERAARIDARAANTWWALINKGTQAASDLAFKNPDEHELVMNLVPYDAIYAVIAERDIRFPDERQKFPWEKLSKMAEK
jgi:O-antigen ligase